MATSPWIWPWMTCTTFWLRIRSLWWRSCHFLHAKIFNWNKFIFYTLIAWLILWLFQATILRNFFMTDYLSFFSTWINSAIDLNCEISKTLTAYAVWVHGKVLLTMSDLPMYSRYQWHLEVDDCSTCMSGSYILKTFHNLILETKLIPVHLHVH